MLVEAIYDRYDQNRKITEAGLEDDKDLNELKSIEENIKSRKPDTRNKS